MLTGGENISSDLRLRMLKAMLKQKMSWFDKPDNAVGILMTRISVDPTMIKQVICTIRMLIVNVQKIIFILQVIGYPLANSCEIMGILLVSIITLPIFSWILAIMVIPYIASVYLLQILYLFVTSKMVSLQKPLMERSSKVAVESINNILLVKSMGIGALMESLYKNRLSRLNR